MANFCWLLCIDFLIKSELNEFRGKRNDNTNDDKNSIFGAEEKIISIQLDYRHVYAIQLCAEQAELRLVRFPHSLFVAEFFFRAVPWMWTQISNTIEFYFLLFFVKHRIGYVYDWPSERKFALYILIGSWWSVRYFFFFFCWRKRGDDDSINIGIINLSCVPFNSYLDWNIFPFSKSNVHKKYRPPFGFFCSPLKFLFSNPYQNQFNCVI